MGIVPSRYLSFEELQQLEKESGFSPHHIDYLLGQYLTLERDAAGRVLRSELLKVPPVALHPFADRLVDVYLHPSRGFRHFINGLSHFRRSLPLAQKLDSLQHMYEDPGGSDGLLSGQQCEELISRLPGTRPELRLMRYKLKQLIAAQALEQEQVQQAEERAEGQVEDQAKEQTEGQVEDEAGEQTEDQAGKQTGDQAEELAEDQAEAQTDEEIEEQREDQSEEQADDQADEPAEELQHEPEQDPEPKPRPEPEHAYSRSCINSEDLAYITRNVDIDESLSLRFY